MTATRVARKDSIMNRTVASGGSAGGDKKAGRVSYWYWSRSPIKYMVTRTGAPGCCTTPTPTQLVYTTGDSFPKPF
jgi:hypothetical protein